MYVCMYVYGYLYMFECSPFFDTHHKAKSLPLLAFNIQLSLTTRLIQPYIFVLFIFFFLSLSLSFPLHLPSNLTKPKHSPCPQQQHSTHVHHLPPSPPTLLTSHLPSPWPPTPAPPLNPPHPPTSVPAPLPAAKP